MATRNLRAPITDPFLPNSLAARARGRRRERFEAIFRELADTSIIAPVDIMIAAVPEGPRMRSGSRLSFPL
jgi:hypothetical protein